MENQKGTKRKVFSCKFITGWKVVFSLVLGSRFFDEVLFSAKLSILWVVFCIVLDEVTDGGGMGIFLGILSAPVFGGAVLALPSESPGTTNIVIDGAYRWQILLLS